MNEDELTQKDIDEYNKRRQEEYDEATKGNEEIRKRREGEGTRDYRNRISKGQYKNKKRKFETDDDIRKRIQAQDEKIAEERKQEQIDQDPELNKQREDMNQGDFLQDPEEEKSFMDARSGFRTGTGLAFEIAANTGLDFFSLVPGSQQAGSAFINYLAQKIRGGEVSKGEILAAAATSQIPGLSQARALTRGGRFARNVAKGGISGGVTTTSMSLVDEGELPSFGEFAAGITAGGLMGGAFDLAPAAVTGNLGSEVSEIASDTGFFLKQLQRKVQGGDLIFDPAVYRGGSFATDGTVAAGKRKPGPKNPDEQAAMEAAGQGNIFKSFASDPRLGQTDDQIMETYKNYRIQKGDPYVDPKKAFKRGLVTRKIKPTDLEPILKEHPEIPKDKVNEYIQFVNRESKGTPKAKDSDLGKTITFLNDAYINGRLGLKKLGNLRLEDLTPNKVRTGSPQEIAEDMSAILGQNITVKTLDNIIQEKVSIPVEVSDTVVMQVTDLKSLTKAYMARVNRFTSIPAFERGHVFAAKNIFNDPNITSLSDYKGNLEPEIARSIYNIVDDQSFNDLLKGVDLEDILKGNRSRAEKSDPDKVVARLLGTDYGLRESFLNFVYPQRALANKIPADAKASFIDDYVEEMNTALTDYNDGGTVGVHTLDFIRAGVLKKILPKYEALNDELIEGLITTTDLVTGKNMAAEVNEAITRNLVNPQEIRRKGEAR